MRIRIDTLLLAAVAVALTIMVPGGWQGASLQAPAAVIVAEPRANSSPPQSERTQAAPEAPRGRPAPREIKAIYLTSWSAATPSRLNAAIQLIRDTELNAVVIDIKDYSGKVLFATSSPLLKSLHSEERRLGDLKTLVEHLHENGIYVIVRIAVFQDQHLAHVRPDLAVRSVSGQIWRDRRGLGWVDPASHEVWNYIVEIGREAAAAGVDELNFDYIRFPSDGRLDEIRYPVFDKGRQTRRQVIQEFFAYLTSQLRSTGVVLSADLFGLVTVRADDLGIGQVLEDALLYFDVVAPMVYPSHYARRFLGFSNSAAHPYEVVEYSLANAVRRQRALAASLRTFTSGVEPSEVHVAAIRPWLQAFDLGAPYPPRVIRSQMQAAYDVGLTSWLLWSPSNKYQPATFQKN